MGFMLFSAAGIVLSILWFLLYRWHTQIIQGTEGTFETPTEKIHWVDLIKIRKIWDIMICKFCETKS